MVFGWKNTHIFSGIRSRKKRKISQDMLPSIFPLSANPALDISDILGLDIYTSYLTKAFHETRIRNIAITGAFGVGKSSIIRSFEESYCHPAKKGGFLYISLGDFRKDDGASLSDATLQNDNDQRDILERRVLLQIYSRFHRRDLPASIFRLIQEHNCFSRNVVSLICGFMTAAVLLLMLHEPVGKLLSANFNHIDFSAFQGPIMAWVATVFSNVDVLKSWVHMILYLLVIVVVAVAVFFIVRLELPRLQAKALTVKVNSLEATYENTACESYIDQHTADIIYCLEQVSDQIHYTVVFEDMDRLDTVVCLKIFTRLREINYLVNLRLAGKDKYLRFIYVANDSLISCLDQSKFFDYIMPIFPRLNEKTAIQIFVANLTKVNDELNRELNKALTPCTDNNSVSKSIYLIAPYLSDYRLQYTVLNEYGLLLRLHQKSNRASQGSMDAERILAFTVYKTLFPEDYSQISQGKSNVFPSYKEAEFNDECKELLNGLRSGKDPLLTANSLYFAGYSRKEIVESWKMQLKNDLSSTLSSIQTEDEQEAHEALTSYCYELDESSDSAIFVAVINYMTERKFDDWEWLFNNKRTIRFVLRILSEFDEDMLHLLFISAGLDVDSDKSIFEKCENLNVLNQSEDFTQKETTVLCMGTGKQFSGNVWIKVESERKATQLATMVSNYWQKHYD